ncbi:MAG TPA: type II toxin-antitoxin system ParD family antitoxin [Rickettsia endosymbiont of Omalisus fontisbellaquei]|jgi:antitoxin ParD1/3/4|nr:type II toxin-antitoxin system ParD family antitoxin [Rickettsia endosymbiont of Omalisus fontisbellaquei]
MNISLTPELEKYVNRQVESGFYHSSSEVIRAALRLMVKSENFSQNAQFENYKTWLNHEIQIGLDQAAEGKLIPGEKALQDIRDFRKAYLKNNG